MENYLKLGNFSIMYQYYAFIDTLDMKADRILYRNRVHVDFICDFNKKDHSYIVVVCKVPRWEKKKFVKSMEELSNLQNILGNGYQEYCNNFSDILVEFEKGKSENDRVNNVQKILMKGETVK